MNKVIPFRLNSMPLDVINDKKSIVKTLNADNNFSTSEKLKRILDNFPDVDRPPKPDANNVVGGLKKSIYGFNNDNSTKLKEFNYDCHTSKEISNPVGCRPSIWIWMKNFGKLIRVTLIIASYVVYYLFYFYVHMTYYILLYAFHFYRVNGQLKITMAAVTITSLVIAFNILERLHLLNISNN